MLVRSSYHTAAKLNLIVETPAIKCKRQREPASETFERTFKIRKVKIAKFNIFNLCLVVFGNWFIEWKSVKVVRLFFPPKSDTCDWKFSRCQQSFIIITFSLSISTKFTQESNSTVYTLFYRTQNNFYNITRRSKWSFFDERNKFSSLIIIISYRNGINNSSLLFITERLNKNILIFFDFLLLRFFWYKFLR